MYSNITLNNIYKYLIIVKIFLKKNLKFKLKEKNNFFKLRIILKP